MSSEKFSQDYRPNQCSVYLIASDGRTLELPIPSNSTKDPLRWPSLKRFLALAAMSLFTVIGLVAVQGTSLLLPALEKEYAAENIKPLRIDMLSSIPTTFWGIGAATWVPLSLAIGRRPVFLLCTIILTGSMFMAAISRGFYVHLGARCLQGLAGAISPSTMILSVIEMTFIHERPLYIAMFWCLTTVVSNIALVFTQYIIAIDGSWRTFYWVWLGPSALSILLALVWLPETYFTRPPRAFDGRVISQSSSGKVTIYSTWEEVPGGKPLPDTPQSEIQSIGSRLKNIIFWNQTTTGGWPAVFAFPTQLLICIFNPLILWVFVLNAFVIGSMVVTCATYAETLTAPPYNLSFRNICLAKLSPAAGALLAFLTSGLFTNSIVRSLAKHNRGIREPEHYLPSFILPVIMCTASLALFGVATQRQWDSHWILIFVGLNYFSAVSIFVSGILWVTEAFPRWAGPAIVVVGAGGYGLSFAVSLAIQPWINSQGLGMAYIELAILTLAIGLVGFPVNYWGKQCREYIYIRWAHEEAP